MNKEYIEGLIDKAEKVKEYRNTTTCEDYTFLEKLDLLLGYISALKDFKVNNE